MVPTFQYPHHRSQPPVLSANSLYWSAKTSSYNHFIWGKRWKSQEAKSGRMMVGEQTLPIENTSGASLLQLQYVAEYCHEEGQYLRTTFLIAFLNKGIKLQHALHIWRESIILRMFTSSLCSQNWQVWCVAIDGNTRDIEQYMRVKLLLILTVVLILWSIGPWKKKIALVCFFLASPKNEPIGHHWFIALDDIKQGSSTHGPPAALGRVLWGPGRVFHKICYEYWSLSH